jgi:threonine dehydratase
VDDDALYIGQTCADEIVLVSEEELGETIAWLHRTTGMAVEGAGAVTVAALRHDRIPDLVGPIAAIVSGRNIDPAKLETLLSVYR